MTTEIIGKRVFGSKVDITDPCYDRDVWCRMNDVEIVPGEYECYVEMASNDETAGWGERVATIGIRLPNVAEDAWYDYLGEIGVDAGMAGFFEKKPDYTDDEWRDFCEELDRRTNNAYLLDVGFFSNSGYGDGGYGVYGVKTADGIVALKIEFIPPEDEEEDDDEWDDEEDLEEDDESEEE